MALEFGELAPDFVLPDQNGNDFLFSELRGRSVLLVFYVHDFSPV
ncbi:MAG: redoxin domain-containing protein [Actinobacteria bacterium]|nr:redoxin domain-containing protein [Actinomycetota bacterium]